MPVRWVEPEFFMEHRGVRVYHAYKDDDSETPLEFWYLAATGKNIEFDVRDLPALDGVTSWSWSSADMKVEVSAGRDAHRRIIRAAINAGAVPFAGLATPPR